MSSSSSQTTTIIPTVVCGFVGLPSAGKSFLINALARLRVLHTGVCRTTMDVHLVGATNAFNFPPERFHFVPALKSDDGVPIQLLDLPGIADSENKGTEKNFNEMTKAWVVNSDVVFWVTDVRTAFLTSHELMEFDVLMKLLERTSMETGTCYQIAVIVSKYEHDDDLRRQRQPTKQPAHKATSSSMAAASKEIEDDDEDTTVRDCYARVVSLMASRTFCGRPITIIKFNAFGRILADDDMGSDALEALVRKNVGGLGCVGNANITFNIGWAVKDLNLRQQQCQLGSLINFQLPKVAPVVTKCERGYLIDAACNSPGVCGCPNMCGCNCCIHGNCNYGKSKRNDDTCAGAGSCKYHRTNLCLMGRPVTDDTCIDTRCPQHNRKRNKETSQCAKTASRFTDPKIINWLVAYLFAKDAAERDLIASKIPYDGSVKEKPAFSDALWLSYCRQIGRRAECLIAPVVCKAVALTDQAITTNTATSAELLGRLLCFLDPGCNAAVRFYITTTMKDNASATSTTSTTYMQPKALRELDPRYHGAEAFRFDVEFGKNRQVSCSKKWVADLSEMRRKLWGTPMETDVYVTMVLMNVWHGNMSSVLAPLPAIAAV